jgi:hypothetical protein
MTVSHPYGREVVVRTRIKGHPYFIFCSGIFILERSGKDHGADEPAPAYTHEVSAVYALRTDSTDHAQENR